MGRLLQPQNQGTSARLLRDERHCGDNESIFRCVLRCGIPEIGGRYDVGSTSEVVYPVRGGMEEWGYAASWFNRYNQVKTVPNKCGNSIPVVITEGSNRCLVFLVETENKKKPPKSSLGDNRDVFLISNNTRDFWIPVLMRQMTVVLDVLRPYSMIVGVSSERIRWNVGGCYEVDETLVMIFSYSEAFHRFVANQNQSVYSDLTDFEYESLLHLVETEKPLLVTPSLKGVSPLRQTPKLSYNPGIPENQLIFESSIRLENVGVGEKVVIIAVSRVDLFMTRVPENENPAIPPQSLFVSLRTNGSWSMRNEKTGRELRGRGKVLSRPVEVASAMFGVKGREGNGKNGEGNGKNGLSMASISSSFMNESSSSSSSSNVNTNSNNLSVNSNHRISGWNASSSTGDHSNLKFQEEISPASAISSFNTTEFETSLLHLKLVYFHNNSSQPFHSNDFILSNLDSISLVFVFFPLCYFTIVLIATLFLSVYFYKTNKQFNSILRLLQKKQRIAHLRLIRLQRLLAFYHRRVLKKRLLFISEFALVPT